MAKKYYYRAVIIALFEEPVPEKNLIPLYLQGYYIIITLSQL